VVAFGSRQTNKKINIIKTNDEDGSFRATSHLIDLGHRRIGLIQAPAGGIVNQNRTGGYIRALTGAGIGVRTDYIVPGGFSTSDGQRAAEVLMSLSPAPTAIVAANDLVAIGAITVLKRLGKRVPRDVSVTGYDNIQMSEIFDPPLTTISQPTYEMGKRAMEVVLNQIERPGLTGKIIELDRPLLIRKSTDKPRFTLTNQPPNQANEKNRSLRLRPEPARLPSAYGQSRSGR
jgi:DNA-binding LacI/PurR family transcriptional regulator